VYVIECPTYEFVVACVYLVTSESLVVARLVTMLGLGAALYYLYRIVRGAARVNAVFVHTRAGGHARISGKIRFPSNPCASPV